MHQSASPVGDCCVPVSATCTHGPNRVPAGDLADSLPRVQSDSSSCSGGAASAGSGDDRQLLGAREDAGGLRPGWTGAGDGASSGDDGVCLDGYTAPVTRSPLDPWHSEEYLVKCLIRMHGWVFLEPRVLRGPWRKRVHCFMNPEGL
jgi:hypothetical protein